MEPTNRARECTELARELENERSKSPTPSELRERRELCTRTRAFAESHPEVAVELALPIARLLEAELARSGDRAAESFGSRTLSNQCQRSLAAATAVLDGDRLLGHLGDHSTAFFEFVGVLEAALDEPTSTAVTRDVLATLGRLGQHSGSVFAEVDSTLLATSVTRVLSTEDVDSDVFRLLVGFAIFDPESFPGAGEVHSAIEDAWLDTGSDLLPWVRALVSTDALPPTMLSSVDRSYASCIEYLLEDRSRTERRVAAEVLAFLTERGILNRRCVDESTVTSSVLRGVRSRKESVAAAYRELLVALSQRGLTDSHELLRTLASIVESMEMSFPKDPRSDVHVFDQLLGVPDLLSEATIAALVDEIESGLDEASAHGYHALARVVSIFEIRTSVETGVLVDRLLESGRDRIEAGDSVACSGLAVALGDLIEQDRLAAERADRFLECVLPYLDSGSVDVHDAATTVVPPLLGQFDTERAHELRAALARSLASSDEQRRGRTLNIVPELVKTGRVDEAVLDRIREAIGTTLRTAISERQRADTATDDRDGSTGSLSVDDAVHSDAVRGFDALRSNGHLSESDLERLYPLVVQSLRFGLFEAPDTAADVVHSMDPTERRVELDGATYDALRSVLFETTRMRQRVAATVVLEALCVAGHAAAHELLADLLEEADDEESRVEALFSPAAESLPHILEAVSATLKQADTDLVSRAALERRLREILLGASPAVVRLLAMDVLATVNRTTRSSRSPS